jgi:hypothetical protein
MKVNCRAFILKAIKNFKGVRFDLRRLASFFIAVKAAGNMHQCRLNILDEGE